MDRNLGAPDVNNHGNSTGTVFFQFGRKDPFACGTLFKPDGTTVSISNIAWDATTQESSKKGKNVPYSIQNPLNFIKNSAGLWTTGDQYCPADGGDFLWQDPNAVSSVDGRVEKSIFDPCPSGWMVPMNGTWAEFKNSNMPWETTKAEGIGRYYYPDKTNYPQIYIYYPSSGTKQYDSGGITEVNNYANSWTSSPNTSTAFVFHSRSNVVESTLTNSRAQGNPIRCIQEYF